MVTILAESTIKMDQALQDLDFVFETLVNVHPNIFFMLSREQAQEEFAKIGLEIKSQDTWKVRDLFKILSSFVAKFKDGHTYLSITDQFNEYLNQGGKVIPFFVFFDDFDVTILASIDENLKPSGKLLSLNGLTVEQLRQQILSMISYEKPSFAYVEAGTFFHLFTWVIFGSQDKFVVEVLNPSGEFERCELDGVDFSVYEQKRAQLNLSVEKLWDLSFVNEETAIVTINTFGSQYEKELKNFIKSSFEQFKTRNIKHLIIDIRKNGGGTTDIVEYLYSFISDKPYRIFSEVHVKYSDEALKVLKIFDPLLLFRVKLLGQRIIVNKIDFKKPRKNDLRFSGDLYLLIGPQTFSAAVDFAAMVKDLSVGKIVGQETGGLASCYGDVLSFELPYSKLRLGVSFKYFVRCGGFDDQKGVIPDIEVQTDPILKMQGIDQAIEKVLESISF